MCTREQAVASWDSCILRAMDYKPSSCTTTTLENRIGSLRARDLMNTNRHFLLQRLRRYVMESHG